MGTTARAASSLAVLVSSGLAIGAVAPTAVATPTPRAVPAAEARGEAAVAMAARSLPSTPVGDGRRTRLPTRGSVVPCTTRPFRASAVPWIVAGTFVQSRQPRVAGAERLGGGRSASVTVIGRQRVLRGSGIPGHPVGSFAGRPLQPVPFAASVPASPRPARTPSCLPSGPVGVLLSGAPLYSPMDAYGRDTLAHTLWDRCDGAPDASGRYRYVRVSSCLGDRNRGPSRLLGYALDGFGIYGPRDASGRVLTNADLDECHGRVDVVTWNGRRVAMYHYVATAEFPYTLGCFRGVPARLARGAAAATPPPAGPVTTEPPVPSPPVTTPPTTPAAPPTTSPPPPPGPPPPPPDITSATLVPSFSRDITDYTVRCTSGSVSVSVRSVAPGTTVVVDGTATTGVDRDVVVPLTEGQSFTWTVSDRARGTVHHARCLPDDFPLWTTERSADPQAEWYVIAPSLAFGADPFASRYVSVVDARGVPVWWQKETRGNPLDAKVLGAQEVTWTVAGWSFALNASYDVRGWDGGVTRTVGGTLDHHDLVRTDRGTYLGLAYVVRPCVTEPTECVDVTGFDPAVPRGDTAVAIVDGEVREYSAAGDLIWSWSTRGHVGLEETGRWFGAGARLDNGPDPAWYDVVHLNSVEDDGDGVIVSARHTDAVYRVLKATGEIDWKLGGTATPRSLSVDGHPDPSTLFGGQHDARRLPDGTVTVHNNGTGRNQAPAALRFRIEAATRSAAVVETITDPRVTRSDCCGSSRRLPGGDWVSSWGGNPVVTEQAADGSPVLTLRFGGTAFSYRASPVLPGVVAAGDLRAGMDAMNPRPPGPQP